jgi:hypothetical protein
MAEEKMRYRFVRAFIVEGLLAPEGQEIVLCDEPRERGKFVLTGSPDSWLADADKSAAVGAITMSRFTVAGAPPLPLPRPVRDIVTDIRSQRRNQLQGRMVLVCQFEGNADALPGSPAEREGERFLFSHNNEVSSITEKHEKDIDRATGSLFVADASVVALEPLGLSFRIMASDGTESLVLGLGAGPVVVITRRGIDAERAVQLKSRFAQCFQSDKDLKTVTRLLSDSLLAGANKLRGFLSAWTALEIFIKKFATKEDMPPDDKRRETPPLINWFNSLSIELGLENPTEKAASFKKIKEVREQVFHTGKDIEDSAFPIEETQNLLRAFLEKVA